MQKILITAATLLSINCAIANSVMDMCKQSDQVCSCAAKQLKTEVGDSDYGLYETIGAAYIANQSKGMGMGDAWDKAVRNEAGKRGTTFANTLNKTNAIGKAHRAAILNCAK